MNWQTLHGFRRWQSPHNASLPAVAAVPEPQAPGREPPEHGGELRVAIGYCVPFSRPAAYIIRPGWLPRLRHPAEQGLAPVLIVAVAAVVQQPEALARICTISPICFKDTLPPTAHGIVRSNSTELNQLDLAAVTCTGAVVLPFVNHRTEPADVVVRHKPGGQSSGPHHQDSGEAKIRESTAGVSRKPSSDGKARGCSSKHLCGLTAWNT